MVREKDQRVSLTQRLENGQAAGTFPRLECGYRLKQMITHNTLLSEIQRCW